jgi:hypothetical protein
MGGAEISVESVPAAGAETSGEGFIWLGVDSCDPVGVLAVVVLLCEELFHARKIPTIITIIPTTPIAIPVVRSIWLFGTGDEMMERGAGPGCGEVPNSSSTRVQGLAHAASDLSCTWCSVSDDASVA